MGSTYQQAGEDVRRLANKLILKFHNELAEADVRIDYIFAFAELDKKTSEKKGFAIMQNGYRALGLARKLGLKDRVMGRGDCEVILDGDEWPNLSEETQAAIVDHELEHFEVAREKDGTIKTDDIDRPKIKMRQHDRQHGWFDNIARRHGMHSIEVKQFYSIFTEAGAIYQDHQTLEGSHMRQALIDAEPDSVSRLSFEVGPLQLPPRKLVPKDSSPDEEEGEE